MEGSSTLVVTKWGGADFWLLLGCSKMWKGIASEGSDYI